jgi:hypothetical protein
MSIEAMKQALEALEKQHNWMVANGGTFAESSKKAIFALEKAIEQAEKQEPFAVAWVLDGELFRPSEYEVISQAGDKAIPLYTSPVHASDISAERVDETAKDRHELAGTMPISNGGVATRTPSSFISPPKREWVGFTHEELAWLNEALNLGGRFAVIEAIEAKLKEKNS